MKPKLVAALIAVPIGFFAYNPLHAAAAVRHAPATCAGHAVTRVVSAQSPHVTNGTAHRDIVLIKAAGHVFNARGGNDLVCGSAGHDVITGGRGADVIRGLGGNDVIDGDNGDDELNGNGGDDVLNGG
ncbi:MAG: hypothetical protein QOJ34_402, partial [Pseudonocardiales bacterium]|nr:hypothetical protein [Pseudonocardiales bacterium]